MVKCTEIQYFTFSKKLSHYIWNSITYIWSHRRSFNSGYNAFIWMKMFNALFEWKCRMFYYNSLHKRSRIKIQTILRNHSLSYRPNIKLSLYIRNFWYFLFQFLSKLILLFAYCHQVWWYIFRVKYLQNLLGLLRHSQSVLNL